MTARILGRRAGAIFVVAGLAASAGLAGLGGPVDAASSSAPSISGNWAGYAYGGANGSVTSVTGQWTVPNAGSMPPGVSSTWTGIGGFTTSDLIQAGTQQTSAPLDQFIAGGAYGAWYELLPASPVFITGCSGDSKCTVAPGDNMTVTITNQGGNNWSISMADGSRWTYSKTLQYASTESSAEWIHESPSLVAVPVPVGNSGTVTFDGSNSAVINGTSRLVGPSGAGAVEALPVETTTSAIDNDGDGFNVCTYSLSCSPTAS